MAYKHVRKSPAGDQEPTERKKPERMGGMGDGPLAEELTLRLVKLVGPIKSRPRFKDVRSLLFQCIAHLQSVTSEPEESAE